MAYLLDIINSIVNYSFGLYVAHFLKAEVQKIADWKMVGLREKRLVLHMKGAIIGLKLQTTNQELILRIAQSQLGDSLGKQITIQLKL
jgi:hypothetical protein